MPVASPEPVPVHGTHVETRIVDPIETAGWDRWLESFPDATPFHTAAWAAVLKRTYGHVPLYLVGYAPHLPISVLPLMEVRSRFTGRRGVCLPFTDFSPALRLPFAVSPSNRPTVQPSNRPTVSQTSDLRSSLSALLSLARSRRWRSIELRGGSAPTPDATSSQTFYRHTLELSDDLDALFECCDPATRRAVRKAGKSGLDIELGHTLGALHEFYALHVRTRRNHGLPPQPFSFFLAIHDEIISRGHGYITVARHDLRPVAAALFLHSGSRAIYKFGASDDAQLELRGNNLVMWESIRWLAQHGFKTLDFGRTATVQDGLRRFKLGWGTQEELVHYYRYCLRTNRYVTVPNRAQGWHNNLFNRLPLPANRILGRLLYPHLD